MKAVFLVVVGVLLAGPAFAAPILSATNSCSEAELDSTGSTRLITAALMRDVPAVQALLKQGVCIDIKDSFGYTALAWMAILGWSDIAALLLEHGSAVNAQNHTPYTDTPLIIASRQGHPQLVKLLLQYGADAQLQDRFGYTALYWAQSGFKMAGRRADYAAIIQLLKTQVDRTP